MRSREFEKVRSAEFESILTPALISLGEIFNKNKHEIELSQVEGFVRQIVGWREYMRGIYWTQMPGYKKNNKLKNKNPLPKFYWNAKTKMN